MKLTALLATTSIALLGLTTTAQAQNDEGWYVRGNLGYGTHIDPDLEGGLDSSFHGDGLESEGNAAWTLGLGYEFANNWRVEGDFDTLWTDLGSISEIPNTSAKLRTNALMLNTIYDFDDFGTWAPYVGAGLGIIRADADFAAHDLANPDLNPNPACLGSRTAGQGESCAINDDATNFGWQLLAGLGYDISENLTWDTHYTYRDAFGDFDLDGIRTNGITNATNPFESSLSNVGSHSLVTGFRYKFGDRPAAAPKVVQRPVVQQPVVTGYTCWNGDVVSDINGCPAQTVTQTVQQYRCWDGEVVTDVNGCKPQTVTRERISERGNNVTALCGNEFRQEIIYYGFDKGQSPETRATIGRVLDIGQYCNVDNIRVVGHTDSSGAASYNQALSQRRAKDARDELVRQGIQGSRITSEGKGESELAVQTGDGVKEQLNRRTEVLITLGSVGVIN